MYFKLKYVEGAIPGKPIKRKTTEELSKSEKNKKYEAKRERKFNPSWKEGRPWLRFNEGENTMTCLVCISQYSESHGSHNLKGQNSFVKGCNNFRFSTVSDHEKTTSHKNAESVAKAKSSGNDSVSSSVAHKTLRTLQEADRKRMSLLFRNTHAVLKHSRPFRDYVWLCKLDKSKSIPVGETYMNEKAAFTFSKYVAEAERNEVVNMLNGCNFFSFMMDGSTDISGDEQEVIYIRCSKDGKIIEKYLGIGTPDSTCSKDLKKFVVEMFKELRVDTQKLVALGSDGASNMTGRKGGLATLIRNDVNSEIINIHCFAHRLELSFRDSLKGYKIYEKLLTLLTGLYYFYMKSYKSKKGLQEAIKATGNGVLPQKATGTRWLPHLHKGITCLLRTFQAYEAHLSSASHVNAKAEGLAKLLINRELVAFVLFLKDVITPLMKLSLSMQKVGMNVADNLDLVKACIKLLDECLDQDSSDLKEVLETGTFHGVQLKGATPKMAYRDRIIRELKTALTERFELNDQQKKVLRAAKLLHLKNWQSDDAEFGVQEVKDVCSHFKDTLHRIKPEFLEEDALDELKVLKKLLQERHGDKLQELKWEEAFDPDYPMMMLIIELLQCIPPTSVSCETTFSHMKLIKTSRRTRLNNTTLNNLLAVRLLTEDIERYDPTPAIDLWMNAPLQRRRPGYVRKAKKQKTTNEPEIVETEPEVVDVTVEEEEEEEEREEDYDEEEARVLLDYMNEKDDDDDNFMEGFMDEICVLEHTGKLEPEKSKDEPYDTGQVFLHNSFNYRGVVLFPWHVRVNETVKTRKGEDIIMHPEMNPHEMASRIGKETNRDRTTYQWFYTVLMDPRDLNSHHPSVQFNSMTYLHQKDPSSLNCLSMDKGLKSEAYFDYAFHDDICPYTSYEISPIQHPRYYALMAEESSEHTREKFKEHHWLQLKDVYTQTTENIKVTVMPTYLGCRKEVTDDLDRKFYYWRYHIRIENLGDQTVTLRRRSWFTMALGDGRNQFQENKGAGVVGEQPRLTVRNNTFQYSSHVVLESHGGYMWGKFTMELDNGNQFECSIPQFNLDSKQSNKPNFDNIKGDKT